MNRSSSNSVYTNVIRRSRKMSSFLGENHENPGNKTKNQEPAKRNEDATGFLPILPEESSTSTVFDLPYPISAAGRDREVNLTYPVSCTVYRKV